MKSIINKIMKNKVEKINKVHTRKNNIKMNIIKAYFIIAVVCSHSGGGGIVFPISNWIQPFFYFMPIFVFVSGYFYNEKYDNQKYCSFVKSKFLTLVLPYFCWNVVYGLLNVIFRKMNIINYGDPFNFNSLFIRPWSDGHQFHFNIAAWFMLSLFIDVIVIYTFRKLLKKIHFLNDIFLLVICYIVSVVSIIVAQRGYNYGMYLCFIKAGFMLPYFQFGYIYKKYEKYFNMKNTLLIIICFILLFVCFVLNVNNPIEAQVVFGNFKGSPFMINAMITISILLTVTICEIFVPAFKESKILNTIGNNTFSIMMHHGIVIFAVNLVLFLLREPLNIDSFDVTMFKKTLWYVYPWRDSRIYILYVVLGISIPLAVKYIYDKMIIYFYKKNTNLPKEFPVSKT